MYQAYFILNIGRPRAARPSAVLQHYNRSMGRASPAMVSKLQAACTEIYAVQTWQGYFERLRLPCPQRCEVLARLRNAVLNSRQKGYHGLRPGETPASLNSQPARTPSGAQQRRYRRPGQQLDDHARTLRRLGLRRS